MKQKIRIVTEYEIEYDETESGALDNVISDLLESPGVSYQGCADCGMYGYERGESKLEESKP